ncbi:MAG: valine--tRNA ligase, partial [Dehalococcoidia bacterium]
KGYFKPKIDPAREPFVIIMPPPNVTGELHLGHALTATMEDLMVRWHRMRGEPTLWLPGIDHAGIAAQVVVEKEMAREGQSRHDLGREGFEKRVWEWMHRYGRTIAEQHKRLGASCDWSRERFTLDEGPSRAVRTTFVHLYEKGLIYRGERIINWCPRCQTALSDLEVDHQDVSGHLYHVRYPLEDGERYITVATTRPETIMGDTAVAVNPKDKRYRGWVGQKVRLPVVDRIIPIIADEAVDFAFGTGAVKITPAHDPVDFEVGQRHGLESVSILNPDATMNRNAGSFEGQDRFVCRENLVAWLREKGLLERVEAHSHAVGHCQRCQTVIEPWASQQWFVKIAPLAAPAMKAVLDGSIRIIPERFTKVYLNWMENIRDWCISRQIWWGHRIPVWYCPRCPEVTVAMDDPTNCAHCGAGDLVRDPDVLDTWFSSGLWPHSTLGWPDPDGDLPYFYPTTVMETGYDILFFWVARMIMMGLENTGRIPFKVVYLHGMVRDEQGDKMSKLRGNVLNPLELIERYGTDALRHSLSTGTSPGNDSRLSHQKIEASRNFANKIWNASRFVVLSFESNPTPLDTGPPAPEDRWILSRLHRQIGQVNQLMEEYQFGEAQRVIHDFLWGEFCDWYIELAKVRLRPGSVGPSPLPVLVGVLEKSLRLLHPFMPFITEEIWQNLRGHLPAGEEMPDSIMIAPYPQADESALDPRAEEEMEAVMDIIRSIRNARAELRLESGSWLEARVFAHRLEPAIATHAGNIEAMARARPLSIMGGQAATSSDNRSLVIVLKESDVVISLEKLDLSRERRRLEKEIEAARGDISRLEAKLDNQAFVSRAPPELVAREREALADHRQRLERLEGRLSPLP